MSTPSGNVIWAQRELTARPECVFFFFCVCVGLFVVVFFRGVGCCCCFHLYFSFVLFALMYVTFAVWHFFFII